MNKVMLIGRIMQTKECEQHIVVSIKIKTSDGKDNIFDAYIKSAHLIDEVKLKLTKQTLIGVMGFLTYLKTLVVVADRITLLDIAGVKNE